MIRIANPKDARLVHKIMLSAFEEYQSLEVPSSALNESVQSIEDALTNQSEMALLYYRGEEPVGSCRFKLDKDSLYFFRLSVSPKARGQGIAKHIMTWLENYATENRKAEIRCRVRAALPKNIELYQSVGFIVSKEEVVTNPNGFLVKTVVMRKLLSGQANRCS